MSENYLNRQYRIFNLAEKLKSFIALNYLGFDFIVDITVLNCGKEALYLSFLKYTGSLTMTRNVFVVDLLLLQNNTCNPKLISKSVFFSVICEALLSHIPHIFCLVFPVIPFILCFCLLRNTWLLTRLKS